MTMKIYRFRASNPLPDEHLAALVGDPTAALVGVTGGHIVDLLVDDSREGDLIEIMHVRGYVYVETNPARVRAHDFFAGVESPAHGTILVGQSDHFVLGRPVITDDEVGLITVDEDGAIVLHAPDSGPGAPGGPGGGGVGPLNEFDLANATAVAKTLAYDVNDLLTQVELFADSDKTMLNYTKDYSYDGNGRLTQVILTRAVDGATFTKDFVYSGEILIEVAIT